ncbi:hypothetical protein B0A49_10770 [Cryomyces minteri]|uniref:Uncharacterized protein n=1 Tax=Cryomyces minteri TaxID=331657 RepID=A0A4U0WPZ4_9PEZI|nr:hypothetical protein B0A49_10770 [Cryomyces minteri]
MADFLGFLKTIMVPAVTSLFLYLLVTYAILPLIQNHRNRYQQYLPLNAISTSTTSLRHRIADTFTAFVLPNRMKQRTVVDGSRGTGSEEELFGDDEGESMVGFDINQQRREALDRHERGGALRAIED